jgi:hypothetical protein
MLVIPDRTQTARADFAPYFSEIVSSALGAPLAGFNAGFNESYDTGTFKLSQIGDYSGSPLVQASGGLQPNYNTKHMNGKPTARFNGKEVHGSYTDTSNAFCTIVVFRPLAALTTYSVIAEIGTCSLHQAFPGSNNWGVFGLNAVLSGVVLTTNKTYVLAVNQRSPTDVDLWTNTSKANVLTGTAGRTGTPQIYGAHDSTPTQPCNGDLAIAPFWNYAAADADLLYVIRAAMAGFGVTP